MPRSTTPPPSSPDSPISVAGSPSSPIPKPPRHRYRTPPHHLRHPRSTRSAARPPPASLALPLPEGSGPLRSLPSHPTTPVSPVSSGARKPSRKVSLASGHDDAELQAISGVEQTRRNSSRDLPPVRTEPYARSILCRNSFPPTPKSVPSHPLQSSRDLARVKC